MEKTGKEIIIDDPLEWYKVSLEIRAEELTKYYEKNKIKNLQYSYQSSIFGL